MRLVQFELRNGERRVGVVQGNTLREVHTARSVRELALAAIDAGVGLAQQVDSPGWATVTTTPRCWRTSKSCRRSTIPTPRTC